MNPDTRPERLNDFLSTVLGRTVKILKVLPNESARIAAESSLLVMYNLKMEVLQMSKCKKSDIFFQGSVAHVIQLICY